MQKETSIQTEVVKKLQACLKELGFSAEANLSEHEGLVYEVVYGVSDNARGWWDNARARELGYAPEGRSEDFVSEALAAQARLPADPVGDYFQGGPFCSEEFEGDLSSVQTAGRPAP